MYNQYLKICLLELKQQEQQQINYSEPKSIISRYFLEEGITQEMKVYTEFSRFTSFIFFHLMILCCQQNTNFISMLYRQGAAEIGRVAVPNQTKISALFFYCPYYLIRKIKGKILEKSSQNQQQSSQISFLKEMRIVFCEEKKPSREMQICLELARHFNLVAFFGFLIAMLWLWPNPTDTPFWSIQFAAQIGRVGVIHLTKLFAIFTIFFHSLLISFMNYLWDKIKHWSLHNNKFLRFQIKDESLYRNDFFSKSDFTFEMEEKNSKDLNLSQ